MKWIPTARVLHPYPNQRFCVWPEAGAQCGSSACLGSVRGVPGDRHSYRDCPWLLWIMYFFHFQGNETIQLRPLSYKPQQTTCNAPAITNQINNCKMIYIAFSGSRWTTELAFTLSLYKIHVIFTTACYVFLKPAWINTGWHQQSIVYPYNFNEF